MLHSTFGWRVENRLRRRLPATFIDHQIRRPRRRCVVSVPAATGYRRERDLADHRAPDVARLGFPREEPPSRTRGSGTPRRATPASRGVRTRRGGCQGRRAARLRHARSAVRSRAAATRKSHTGRSRVPQRRAHPIRRKGRRCGAPLTPCGMDRPWSSPMLAAGPLQGCALVARLRP